MKTPPTHRLEKIRVITLDVFNTLIAPNPSVGHIYAHAVAKHVALAEPLKNVAERINARFPIAWKRLRTEEPEPADETNARAFWEKVVRLTMSDDCPPEHFPIVFADAYTAFSRPENWRVLPGTRAALAAYQFLGYRLAAFTNADSRMRTVLRELELDKFFEQIFISTEIGFSKPSPAAFRHVFEKMKVAPVDVLHVGDSRDDDVTGALNAGARAAWFAPGAHFKPAGSVVVKSLPELADKLRFAETRQLLYAPESKKQQNAFAQILDDPQWRGRIHRKTTRNLVANLRELPEETPFGKHHRHENPVSGIGAAMLEFAATLRTKAEPLSIISEAWPELIGKHFSACEPQRITPDGTLIVHCTGASVRSNLIMDTKKILAAIKQKDTGVNRVSFQL